jgi:hypothetical protein
VSIYVQRNFDQPESAKEYRFSGLLIDFLQEHFPQGFGEYEAAISLNGELLAVEDYDAEVLLADHVIILLLPGTVLDVGHQNRVAAVGRVTDHLLADAKAKVKQRHARQFPDHQQPAERTTLG